MMSLKILLGFLCGVAAQEDPPPLLLVSFDGFRADYLKRFPMLNLKLLCEQGVLVEELINVFVTKTFPNHYSLVTGLYAESHGILANNMYDPVKLKYFHNSKKTDPWWWSDAEPLWVTALDSGYKTAAMMWPGSDLPIRNRTPTHFFNYDAGVTFRQRAGNVTKWILGDGKEGGVKFAALYWEEPDRSGHLYGPDNTTAMAKALKEVDDNIGLLVSELKRTGLWGRINILIASDHGMTQCSTERLIRLDDCLQPDSYTLVDLSPVTSIIPHTDPKTAVDLLNSCHAHIKAYLKEDIPDRLHYKNSVRIQPIIVIADEGWTIVKHGNRLSHLGDHGYDNALPSMHPFLAATGPSFRQGYRLGSLQSVDIYPLMCHLLSVPPRPNNGTLIQARCLLAAEACWDAGATIRLVVTILLLLTTAATQQDPPPLLLVSFDGFRADYLKRFPMLNLKLLYEQGVLVEELTSVFVTKTFPNHYSLVTGLYAESHGIVAHVMYDPVWRKRLIIGKKKIDPRWWNDAEPLWLTALDSGYKTATAMWPGSDLPIRNRTPTHFLHYNFNVTFKQRLGNVTKWILGDEKEEGVKFAVLYWEDPDLSGHIYGPDNTTAMSKVLKEVDDYIGLLVSELKRTGLWGRINILILSDHGMAQCSTERLIRLDDCLQPDSYTLVDLSPVASVIPHIDPKTAVDLLNLCHDHIKAYLKEDIPDRFHYKNNVRIQPIIVIADDGWTIVKNGNKLQRSGDHGYDNALPSMHPFLAATGPSFRRGFKMSSLQSLDIYPLMCHLLLVPPRPNNGSLCQARCLLANETCSGDGLTPRIIIIVLLVFITAAFLFRWLRHRPTSPRLILRNLRRQFMELFQ